MIDDVDKDREWWESYFSESGGWESNGGRLQTRIFAENFTNRTKLNLDQPVSILDVGCALGDSIQHFSEVYPQATLYGIDFSETAISRCKKNLGEIGVFSVGDIDSVSGNYDIIYCSNTLEHFSDFDQKARHLVKHCKRLCILVPFNELVEGKPIVPSVGEHHQHTFLSHSFDFLIKEGMSKNISTDVFSAPGAWGWDSLTKIKNGVRNMSRLIRGKPRLLEPKQILFDITNSN